MKVYIAVERINGKHSIISSAWTQEQIEANPEHWGEVLSGGRTEAADGFGASVVDFGVVEVELDEDQLRRAFQRTRRSLPRSRSRATSPKE